MTSRTTRIACLAVATMILFTASAVAQDLGGVTDRVLGGNAQAAANNQVQAQVQQKVQEQVQQQVQSQMQLRAQQQAQAEVQAQLQAQGRLQAEVARAAAMANRAIDSARETVRENRGGEVSGRMRARVELGIRPRDLGVNANANARAKANANANLPDWITDHDVQLYDMVFGQSNPFRATVVLGAKAQGTPMGPNANARIKTEIADDAQAVVTVSGTEEMDLATRIDAAVHQRRAEISQLRDEALEKADTVLMEQADQMEQVLDMFIEARVRAAAEANSDSQTGAGTGSQQFNAGQSTRTEGNTEVSGNGDGR